MLHVPPPEARRNCGRDGFTLKGEITSMNSRGDERMNSPITVVGTEQGDHKMDHEHKRNVSQLQMTAAPITCAYQLRDSAPRGEVIRIISIFLIPGV